MSNDKLTPSNYQNLNPSIHQSVDPEEINLLDCWRVIMGRKKFIVAFVGVATVAAVIISLLLPKIYKSQAVLMPLGGGGGGGGLAAIAAQFSGLPLVGGLGGVSNTPAQRLMAILKTRTLAEEVINKSDLLKVMYADSWDEVKQQWKNPQAVPNMEDAVKRLRGSHMEFVDEKDSGTLTIDAKFRDPELAAKIANSYLETLQEMINKNSFTVTKRNRIFVEGQLTQNKKDLLEVGKELNEFYKNDRVSDVASRVDVSLGMNDEYNFGRSSYLASNMNKPEEAWNVLEDQKGDIRKKIDETQIVKDVPQQVYLQYLALRRELLGKMNTLLTQQYEMAKIEEAKEDLAFQVLDPARVPIMRSSPRRTQIVIMSFMASAFFAVFLAFFLEYIRKMKALEKV